MSEPQNDEPNWDLLSSNPRKFFDIGPDANQKDLKRSYNRFIKRYKPEKFPEEFKKIRQAYEMLSEDIRYGFSSVSDSEIGFPLDPDVLDQPDSTSQISNRDAEPNKAANWTQYDEDFFQSGSGNQNLETKWLPELGTQTPSEIYLALKDKSNKTPKDFLVLAMLSDLINPTSEPKQNDTFSYSIESFEGWILRGVSSCPNSTELVQALRKIARRQLDPEHCIAFVKLCGQRLSSRQFFYLTESVWQQILQECSFATFQETLQACEKQLGLVEGIDQIIFYIQILKTAIWKANTVWIDQKLKMCEEEFIHLPFWAQNEIEGLEEMARIVYDRHIISEHSPFARKLIQTIEEYFLTEGFSADRKVIQFQREVFQAGTKLTDHFKAGFGKTLGGGSIIEIWRSIVTEVNSRIGYVDIPSEKKLRRRKLKKLFGRLDQRYSRTSRFIHNANKQRAFYYLLFLTIFMPILCFLRFTYHYFLSQPDQGLPFMGFAVLWAGFGGLAVYGLSYIVFSETSSNHNAYRFFRRDLAAFFRATPCSPEEAAELIRRQTVKNFTQEQHTQFYRRISFDIVMVLLSLARKTMKKAS